MIKSIMSTNSTFKVIIGWVLVFAGLAVIGQAVNSSYQYFSAKADFPAIIKTANTVEPVESRIKDSLAMDADAAQKQQMQQSLNLALGNILPTESVTETLNAIIWSIFATFLVFSGGKITSLGIQFLSSKSG